MLDQFGNPVPDAVLLSDSSFDYLHPSAVEPGSAAAEPDSLLLTVASFSGLLFGLGRRDRGKWLASPTDPSSAR